MPRSQNMPIETVFDFPPVIEAYEKSPIKPKWPSFFYQLLKVDAEHLRIAMREVSMIHFQNARVARQAYVGIP